MLVSAYKGAEYAAIIGVSQIYVTGSNGMDAAIIDSFGVGWMQVDLMSDEAAEDATIYCNCNDTCTVRCLLSGACISLEVDCCGPCLISCDPLNGIVCPTTVTGNFTILYGTNTSHPTSLVPFSRKTITQSTQQKIGYNF